jgi:hypothetical protein
VWPSFSSSRQQALIVSSFIFFIPSILMGV